MYLEHFRLKEMVEQINFHINICHNAIYNKLIHFSKNTLQKLNV